MMASCINQDCLENLNFRIHGISGENKHPGPIQCIQRLRILFLRGNADKVIQNPSVKIGQSTDDSEEQYLTASVLQDVWKESASAQGSSWAEA